MDAGWTFDGFRVTTGQELRYYANYYVAEYRAYWGYDKNLQVGPYNFGFLDNPCWATGSSTCRTRTAC